VLSNRRQILTKSVLYAVVSISLLVGCSDNPQNKAARELRRVTDKALALADKGPGIDAAAGPVDAGAVYAKARQELAQALANAAVAGEAADSAYLAGGNLCFAQVRHIRNQLAQQNLPIAAAVDDLSVLAGKIVRLQIQQERLEQLDKLMGAELAQLAGLLEGTVANKGFKAQLADVQDQLNGLDRQRAQWETAKQQAQDEAGRIQAQGDAKLQQAQLAPDPEKSALEKEGFDLLLAKKEPLVQAQEAADRIKILDGEIALVKPKVEKLLNDVDKTARRIDEIQNSPEKDELQKQITKIKGQLDEYDADAGSLAANLTKGLEAYTATTAEMTDLLDKAIADYRKIRSRSLAQTGKSRLADCHFYKASVAAERIAFNRHIAARLDAIAEADLGTVSTTLANIAKQYSQVNEQASTAVMDSYDQAVTGYTAAGGKEVMSSHALALYGKMTFAEQLGDYDKADAAMDAARNLLGEIAKSDPVFFKSITARLVTESTDYIPPMPVNYAAQYEEFKKQFQGWKRLRGDEMKVEVERLLAMLDNTPQPLDPDAFKRIIEPERQALQAQMAKGFDEVEIEIDLSDPNYF